MIDEPKGRGTEGLEGGIRGERGRTNATEKGLGRRDSEREELVMHGVAGGGSRSRASEHSGNKGKIEGETRSSCWRINRR